MNLIRVSFLTGTTWFAWRDPCHMTPLWLWSVRDGTRRLVLLCLAFWTFGRRRLQKGSSETSCGSAIWGRWKGGSTPSSRLWRKCRINMLPSSGHRTVGTSALYLHRKPPEPVWNWGRRRGAGGNAVSVGLFITMTCFRLEMKSCPMGAQHGEDICLQPGLITFTCNFIEWAVTSTEQRTEYSEINGNGSTTATCHVIMPAVTSFWGKDVNIYHTQLHWTPSKANVRKWKIRTPRISNYDAVVATLTVQPPF